MFSRSSSNNLTSTKQYETPPINNKVKKSLLAARLVSASAVISLFLSSQDHHDVTPAEFRPRHDDDDNDAIHRSSPRFLPTPHHRHLHYHANNIREGTDTTSRHDDSSFHLYDHDDDGITTANDNIRISFQLHDPEKVPLKHEVNFYHCDESNRASLPPSLRRVDDLPISSFSSPSPSRNKTTTATTRATATRSGRILPLTTLASTDLKLLHLADSVLDQFADSFGEMLDAPRLQSRRVLGRGPDTIVSPTRGGGVSAVMRITELLARKNEGKPSENNAHGGGWCREQVERFLDFPHPERGRRGGNETRDGGEKGGVRRVERFDAAIVRVMHGWMTPEEITKERLLEAIRLSYELFGVTVAVLMTVPFTNSVKTMYDYYAVQLVNREIRNIADTWHEAFRDESDDEKKGVRHVLLLDFDMYCNHVIWSNAMHLGYNVTEPLKASESTFDEEVESFLFDRLNTGKKYPPSIAMVCDSRKLRVRDSQCERTNMLWKDGMHICPETMSSRYGAAMACLLGCVFNGHVVEGRDDKAVKECERECNEQFMSVMPVDDSWVDEDITLASFGHL